MAARGKRLISPGNIQLDTGGPDGDPQILGKVEEGPKSA
jgi:hypothetical protein